MSQSSKRKHRRLRGLRALAGGSWDYRPLSSLQRELLRERERIRDVLELACSKHWFAFWQLYDDE